MREEEKQERTILLFSIEIYSPTLPLGAFFLTWMLQFSSLFTTNSKGRNNLMTILSVVVLAADKGKSETKTTKTGVPVLRGTAGKQGAHTYTSVTKGASGSNWVTVENRRKQQSEKNQTDHFRTFVIDKAIV